jgi:hypothetical protein
MIQVSYSKGLKGRMTLRSAFVGPTHSSVLAGKVFDKRQVPFEYEKFQNLVANTLQNNTVDYPGFKYLSRQERTRVLYLIRQIWDLAEPMNWSHLELIRPMTDFLLEYMNYFPNYLEDPYLSTSWGRFIASEEGKRLSKCHPSLPVKLLRLRVPRGPTLKSEGKYFPCRGPMYPQGLVGEREDAPDEEEESPSLPIKREGTWKYSKENRCSAT